MTAATPPKFRETTLTRHRWPIFGALVVVILAIYFVFPVVPRWLYGDTLSQPSVANTYEMTNALFAALAFAGVVFTILLQSEELRLQRQELEETQAELRRSAGAHERSERMLFLAAYLNACNSVIEGFQLPVEDFKETDVRPTDQARAELIAYVDALQLRLASSNVEPLINIPRIDIARQRLARITAYLTSRLARVKLVRRDVRFSYLAHTLEHVSNSLRATCSMLRTTDSAENSLANRLAEAADWIGASIDVPNAGPDELLNQADSRASEAVKRLIAISV